MKSFDRVIIIISSVLILLFIGLFLLGISWFMSSSIEGARERHEVRESERQELMAQVYGTNEEEDSFTIIRSYEMTQHGFARDSMFEVKEITEETATFSLTDSQETLKKYPFKFELVIKYTLEEKTLTVTYAVKNRSTRKVMYYGIGGHPAFNVSQTADEDGNTEFDKISFHFEPNNEQLFIPLSTEGLLKLKEAEKQTVDEIQLTHDTFKEDALIYKVEPNSEMVLTDETEGVEIRLNPLEMEHVGVWSPYPARGGFVCLEPWAGVADDEETSGQFNEKYGIHKLNPEQIMTHEYTIQFTKKAD